MNPLRLLKIYRRADKVLSLMEEGNVKSLWASKTFWFNLLTAGSELAGVLPLPPGTAMIVASIVNIGLRLVTDKPVSILPK